PPGCPPSACRARCLRKAARTPPRRGSRNSRTARCGRPSPHPVADRNRLRTADKRRLAALRLARELNSVKPWQKLFPENAHLHPREMLAEADMRAIAERNLLVGRAIDPERKGGVEDLLVPVSRGIGQKQPVALGDLLPGHRRVRHRRAHEVLHW